MTPAVECDAAVALLYEEQHLTIPCIGIERPTVREGDDRACSPVLVVDLNAILGRDGAHVLGPLRCCRLRSQRLRGRSGTAIAAALRSCGQPDHADVLHRLE